MTPELVAVDKALRAVRRALLSPYASIRRRAAAILADVTAEAAAIVAGAPRA